MDLRLASSAKRAIGAAVLLIAVPCAQAEPWAIEGSTSLSSGLIDRGETLATLNNETSFSLTRETDFGGVYAGLYRISPIGSEAGAFDEEVDFTIGMSFEQNGAAFDVSANYLTYPGSAEEKTLELAGEVGFDLPIAPSLAVFYDIDQDIYGAEAAVSPAVENGPWTLTGIARVGLVASDEADYSYGGLEGVISRQIDDAFAVEGFARIEAADADNFVATVRNDQVTETKSNGAVLGLRLNVQR